MCSSHSRQANKEDEDPRGSSSLLHGQFISSETPHLCTLNLEDKQNLMGALNGPYKSCPGCVYWNSTYPPAVHFPSHRNLNGVFRNLTCSMGYSLGTIELINKHLKSCLFVWFWLSLKLFQQSRVWRYRVLWVKYICSPNYYLKECNLVGDTIFKNTISNITSFLQSSLPLLLPVPSLSPFFPRSTLPLPFRKVQVSQR